MIKPDTRLNMHECRIPNGGNIINKDASAPRQPSHPDSSFSLFWFSHPWQTETSFPPSCFRARRATWWPSSTSTRSGLSWPGRCYWTSNMWVLSFGWLWTSALNLWIKILFCRKTQMTVGKKNTNQLNFQGLNSGNVGMNLTSHSRYIITYFNCKLLLHSLDGQISLFWYFIMRVYIAWLRGQGSWGRRFLPLY